MATQPSNGEFTDLKEDLISRLVAPDLAEAVAVASLDDLRTMSVTPDVWLSGFDDMTIVATRKQITRAAVLALGILAARDLNAELNRFSVRSATDDDDLYDDAVVVSDGRVTVWLTSDEARQAARRLRGNQLLALIGGCDEGSVMCFVRMRTIDPYDFRGRYCARSFRGGEYPPCENSTQLLAKFRRYAELCATNEDRTHLRDQIGYAQAAGSIRWEDGEKLIADALQYSCV